MACGGSQYWELICPICKTFIETKDDYDMQGSLEYHYLNVHHELKDVSQPSNQLFNNCGLTSDSRYFTDANLPQDCTNYLICPLCDSIVEIFQNNINHFFMGHFETYHQKILNSNIADTTPSRRIEIRGNTEERPHDPDSQVMKKKLCPSNFFNLPSDLEKHRGFINFENNYFLCHVCTEIFNSQQIMEDHLKTKRHEDNVIIWLRNKLSKHMHSAMEFISFYGSSLCCNLCRCKLELNSVNPHETLLNIISHNTDAKHSQKKSLKDSTENIGSTILHSLIENNLLISDNKDFFVAEMEPLFKCKLCKQTIHFSSKSDYEIEKILIDHIKSVWHNKNKTAIEINSNSDGRQNRKSNQEQLMDDLVNCSEVGTSFSEQKKLNDSSVSSNKLVIIKNHNNTEKNSMKGNSSDSQSNTNQVVKSKAKERKVLDVKGILRPLQNQFGKITYIADNEDGKLTCLICNCPIQPTTYGVKLHISGKFHKNKVQCQIKEFNTLNIGERTLEKKTESDGKIQEPYQDLIDYLFQSLPERFQNEKDLFTVNLTDGFINCILCNSKIDPLVIESHLQEERHVYNKQQKLV